MQSREEKPDYGKPSPLADKSARRTSKFGPQQSLATLERAAALKPHGKVARQPCKKRGGVVNAAKVLNGMVTRRPRRHKASGT